MANEEEKRLTAEGDSNNTGVNPDGITNKPSNFYPKEKATERKTRSRERISRKEFNLRFKAYFKSRLFCDYAYIIFSTFLGMASYDYFIAATTSNGITPSGIEEISRGIAVEI